MTVYTIVEQRAEGFVVVTSQYGRQIFTRRKLRKKPRNCATCGIAIPAGAEAYGPLTNAYNRMHRVHEQCFQGRT